MKKILTGFIIVLLVLASGMTALVVLLNPNDYRDYLARQVEKKSGYQLTIKGDLRWHVWPQLSVIAGKMALTAPGAKTSFISAENMRLDVELWPLLSHQLKVKQVILKGATINLIPGSQPVKAKALLGVSTGDMAAAPPSQWKLGIDKVQLMDSLLIWQKENEAQINIRNLNLDLIQNENKQIKISLSSHINRNQRDLTLSLKANLDLAHYLGQINADIQQLDYQLQGADLPVNGIEGTISVQALYDKSIQKLILSDLNVSANNNHFAGDAKAVLSGIPAYFIRLEAKNIDLDEILGWEILKKDDIKNQGAPVASLPNPVSVPALVIATNNEDLWQNLQGLRDFNADLLLNVDALSYRRIKIKNIHLSLKNRQGELSLNPLSGEVFEGHFSLDGIMDLNRKKMRITVNPVLKDIALKPLLEGFSLSPIVSGKASFKGTFSGDDLNFQSFLTRWKGNANVITQTVQFNGINLQQLIEQTVARHTDELDIENVYQPYTAISQLDGSLTLNAGQLKINDLTADSHLLSVTGTGLFNLPDQQADLNLNVHLIQGLKGKAEWIKTLQSVEVPLRIYGPWEHLQYGIDVQSLLNKGLKEQLHKKLKGLLKGLLKTSFIETNKNSHHEPSIKKTV